MNARMAFSVFLLSLSGGAFASSDSFPTTNKSVSQICEDIEKRGVYAVYDYTDHLMETEGYVRLFSNSNVSGRFLLRGKNDSSNAVIVNAYPEDVHSLNSNNKQNVRGVITGINTDDGCVITINTRR